MMVKDGSCQPSVDQLLVVLAGSFRPGWDQPACLVGTYRVWVFRCEHLSMAFLMMAANKALHGGIAAICWIYCAYIRFSNDKTIDLVHP